MMLATMASVGLAKKNGYVPVYNSGYMNIQIVDVVRSDTATVIKMQSIQNPGDEFWFTESDLYLNDEQKRSYPLKALHGIVPGKNIAPISGILNFSLVFDALPREVRIFDLIPQDRSEADFAFWGIHDKKWNGLKKLRKPGNICLKDEICLDSGNVVIRGRIESFVEKSRPKKIETTSVTHKGEERMPDIRIYDTRVDSAGVFELHVPLENTSWLYLEGRFGSLPVMAYPNDTINLVIRKPGEYDMCADYTSSKGYNLMKNLMEADPHVRDMRYFILERYKKMRIHEFEAERESIKSDFQNLCNYLTWKYRLSDEESHLLLLSMTSVMDALSITRMSKNYSDTYTHRPGTYMISKLQKLIYLPETIQNWSFVQEINLKDYSYFVFPMQTLLVDMNDILPVSLFLDKEERMNAMSKYLGQEIDDEWKKRLRY